MSQRITPLTRNQLLELEALVRSLINVVTQPPPQPPQRASSTPASAEDQSWPSSAATTPTSLTGTAGRSPSAVLSASNVNPVSTAASSSAFAFAGLSTSYAVTGADDVDAGTCQVDHPVLHGTFIDVFADPLTVSAWRLYDKILYIVWWSYRPQSCTSCGMQDAWMPSGDAEFKCAFCIAGAGTTRSNAVVEDVAAANEETEYGNDSGEDDDVEEKDKPGGGGGGASSGAGGGPIELYLFFYEWLQRIPLLGPAGASLTSAVAITGAAALQSRNGGGGGGHDVSNPQRLSTTSNANAAAMNYTRAGRSMGGSAAAQQQQPRQTPDASSSVMLPSGESLPTVLRAAYDMSCLLTAPGLPQGTAPVIRAAGLYMSLLLHRYVSLFPLFCEAGRATAAVGNVGRGGAAAATAAAAKDTSNGARAFDSADAPLTAVQLQWVDVELVCALLGVTAPSFFESMEVSVQHLQNVFTVAAAYGVPSVLWHPGRVPGRVETVKSLREKVIPLCPLHATAAGVSGLCPEHTAMVVALEFARRVDAHPIAASSTSPAAAAQNAQRIGAWLDGLGLYPTRRVYRDLAGFHHAVEAQAQMDGESGPTVKKEEEEEKKAVSDDDGTVRAWERTLTELAAVQDAHLTAAAARHAHRHDTTTAAAAATARNPSSSPPPSPPLLATPRSPFYKRFEWILTSPCANALLHVFAAVFRLTPMELADMALRSGIYQGHASGFVATLRSAMLRGAYDAMPLARRLSPLTSSWTAAYMALHSADRLPLLAALFQFNDGQNATRDRQAALTRLLQRILRKHQASQLYQLNYVLRVTDEDEKHFNGIYFLSNVLWGEGLAVFTCLRSGRKTITFNRFARTLSLCYLNAKEKIVSRLRLHIVSPVVAAVETDAARLVMEVALGTVARGVSTHGDPWGAVVRCLDKCARVRRRMRVPMLASRLDALASIRESNTSTGASTAAAAAAARHFSQFASLHGGGKAGMMSMGPTLLGWGETETLLAAAPQLDVRQLRRDLQSNFLALPNASLLSGLSENRVVAMYASLVGILELIHSRLLTTSATTPQQLSNNWVEELLFVEEDEAEEMVDEDVAGTSRGFASDFSGVFVRSDRTGPSWSPPLYRNSRGGTPKRSRSPKSKFVAVSTATNSTSSAFTTSFAGSGNRYVPTPPQSFARAPYTMTPPSMQPTRSPVLRAATTANARGGTTDGNVTSSAFTSHNTASTPINRFQSPPSTTTPTMTAGSGGSGNGPSRAPPLKNNAGDSGKRGAGRMSNTNNGGEGVDAFSAGVLPDLELSASTAEVEKRLSAGARTAAAAEAATALLPERRRYTGRRREREGNGNDDDDDEEDEEDCSGGETATHVVDNAPAQQPEEQVLRLLGQALPSYWEVLLGSATDLALLSASATTAAGDGSSTGVSVRGGATAVDDDDDEGENGGGGGGEDDEARRTTALTRERRLRRRHHPPPPQTNESNNNSATAATAPLRGEASVTHRPFDLFDAEECRRRLHRLYVFIGRYIQCKQRCQELAATGTLPTLRKTTSTASPALSSAASVAKPPTVAAAAAGGGGSPFTPARTSNGLLRSPRTRLSPPPPFTTSGSTANSAGSGLQRSPRRPPTPSPPHSPEPRSSIRSNNGGGGASPASVSPSLTPTGRRSAVDGANGGSPPPPSTSPPLRSSSPPQQHGQRLSGTAKPTNTPSPNSSAGGHGARAKPAPERTAVALVDDEGFSLPPSAVPLADTQEQQQPQPLQQQQQQQHTAASNSTTSSDTEEEETQLEEPVPFENASHKRTRDDNSGSDSDGDGDGDVDDKAKEDLPMAAPPQEQLRRKAKKLGRRRRRKEQNFQYQQQQHVNKTATTTSSPPLRSNGSSGSPSKESSRSPEVRAWRHGRISGSVSPLGNSPALPPRTCNAEAFAKTKARTRSHPSSPTQEAVPTIRGRVGKPSEGGEAAASSSSSSSRASSVSDSGRSTDYDADTN